MYSRISKYIFKYKGRVLVALFSLFAGTFLNGMSLSLMVPLVDKVLVQGSKNAEIVIFDVKQEKSESLLKEIETSVKIKANDFVKNKTPLDILKIFSIFLFFLIFIKGFCSFGREYLMESVSYKIIKDIRDDMYAHLHFLSMDFFTKKHVGEIMSRITNDTGYVQNAVCRGWTEMLFDISNIVIYTAIAFYINFKLAIFAIVIMPCLVYPIIALGRRIKKISQNTQEKNAIISSIINETMTGIKVVKAFGMEQYEIKKFKKETWRFYQVMMKFVKRNSIISPLMELVGVACGIAFLLFGGREVLSGVMTKGEFILFIIAILSLLHPFRKIGKSYNMIQMASAAFKRIFELLDTKTSIIEVDNPKTLTKVKNKITFKDVSISYNKQEIVLDNINFEAKVGDIVAFVGPSGVGKTSLLNLLPRFYDAYKGEVLIDNVNIKEYSLFSLRSQMGIVTQDIILFHDTVRANIAYGHSEISDEKIIEAAKIANAHDFIMNLKNGYDTEVGQKGDHLSGGERQRIAIARAVLKNPPILILDEATSALDTESERAVQEAIERLMRGRTVFVIAHRLSTVKNASKIIVIDNKSIEQIGTHEQLMVLDGMYQKLYNLQS